MVESDACRGKSAPVSTVLRFAKQVLWSPSARFLLGFSVLFSSVNYGHLRLFSGDNHLLLALATARSWISVLWLFALLSLSRWLFVVLVPIICIVSACFLYFIVNYRVYINENVIGLVLESNLQETSNYISTGLVVYVLVAIAASSWLSFVYFRKYHAAGARAKLALTVLALLLNWALPVPRSTRSNTDQILPFSVATKTYIYLREQHTMARLLATRTDLSTFGSVYDGDSLTVVLIIGEAARPDHFHINGYRRGTSPYLEKLGALSFPWVLSLEASTRYALPCMLTRSTPQDLRVAYRETSFIPIFRKHGFWCEWISNQGQFWALLRDRAFTPFMPVAGAAIAAEADTTIYVNKSGDTDCLRKYDEELLPYLEAALAHDGRNKLIVLHTIGSHWNYDMHYPDSFCRFVPTCGNDNPQACSPEALVNSYDNSILYTDWFFGQVAGRVENDKALVFFASDHGESLGEDGNYIHVAGSHVGVQREAALFAWASQGYAEQYPRRYENLKRHQTEAFTHERLFHTVLDCAGIFSDVVDTGLSLCGDGPPPKMAPTRPTR